MTKATAEWVQKAEDDWFAANQLSQGNRPLHDQVSFHCQQCAEKYLKALLQELALAIPRTHDLEVVLDLLLPHHRTLRSLRRGSHFLSGFAVDVRYPGERVTKRKAAAALRWADRTRTATRFLLGLRP